MRLVESVLVVGGEGWKNVSWPLMDGKGAEDENVERWVGEEIDRVVFVMGMAMD